MKKQTNMFQVKEQGNTSEKDLNETEISDLTWWKYKRMVIKIFTKLKRKMEGQSENLKTEAENKRKHQIEVTELKNTMTEMENITWRFNSRPDEARKKRVTALNDRALELTQSQQQTEKKKSEDSLGNKCCCLVVVFNSLRIYGLQHARLSCPLLSSRVCSNSHPLSQWCHPTISSCHPLLLLPSIFPSIKVFSNE